MIISQEKSWFDTSVNLVNALTVKDLQPINKRISNTINRIHLQASEIEAKMNGDKLPYNYYYHKWLDCKNSSWYIMVNLPQNKIIVSREDKRDNILFGKKYDLNINKPYKDLILESMSEGPDITEFMENLLKDIKDMLLSHLTEMNVKMLDTGLSLSNIYTKTSGKRIAEKSNWLNSKDTSITKNEILNSLSNTQKERLLDYLNSTIKDTIMYLNDAVLNIEYNVIDRSTKSIGLLLSLDGVDKSILTEYVTTLRDSDNIVGILESIQQVIKNLDMSYNGSFVFNFYKDFILDYYKDTDLDNRGVIFMLFKKEFRELREIDEPFRINSPHMLNNYTNSLFLILDTKSAPIILGPNSAVDREIEASYKNFMGDFKKLTDVLDIHSIKIEDELYDKITKMKNIIDLIYTDFREECIPNMYSLLYQHFSDIYGQQ